MRHVVNGDDSFQSLTASHGWLMLDRRFRRLVRICSVSDVGDFIA
jgi:hypothetical protein